jgi:hypothetical protein
MDLIMCGEGVPHYIRSKTVTSLHVFMVFDQVNVGFIRYNFFFRDLVD